MCAVIKNQENQHVVFLAIRDVDLNYAYTAQKIIIAADLDLQS